MVRASMSSDPLPEVQRAVAALTGPLGRRGRPGMAFPELRFTLGLLGPKALEESCKFELDHTCD